MIGLLVAFLGFVLVAVGLVVTLGLWTLMPVGAVLVLVGLLADLDSLKEPPHAERRKPAP